MKELIIMKRLIPTIALLAIGLLTSSCERQAEAQNSQPGSQPSLMNSLPIEPAPNPEDAKRQLPPLNTDPLPGFPPPANPAADIGEQVAAEKALKLAVIDFKATNPKVIKSSLMSYKEARQQLSEPIEEDHPLFNTPVRVIEISGTFKRRSHRPSQKEVPTSTPTFTKGYIILRAADGFLLLTKVVR